ncbi:MAG: DNA-directed RNA polymerase subunit N [Thaumarchaeota archaeon]|nr:DNA-directed RNA polymerase subunit N [Nitrososphaerota archaeon]
MRCITCGNLIADKYEEYKRRMREGEEPKHVLDEMGLKRYCCRRMLLASVDLMDQVLPYYEELARRHAEYSQ